MTTKGAVLKAIRKHCLDCCCGSYSEVSNCLVSCSLHPFRLGTDPEPKRRGRFSKTPSTEGKFSANESELIVRGG